jgi:homogentisate 1,2-dioxygenase
MVETHRDDRRDVFFGVGSATSLLAALEAADAQRVLFVGTGRVRDTMTALAAQLGDRAAGVLDIAAPQVPVAVAEQGREAARAHGADWVVAVGGGTAVGLAKAIALTEDVGVAAIATTYAGSEMTDIFGITSPEGKTTGRDARVRPTLVAYDPADTLSLPMPIALASGLNALAHSVEALYAVNATDTARAAASASVCDLLEGLTALSADPTDLQARATTLRGAWRAGVALDGASMALHHKLAHVLGGRHALPHAQLHAALLPYTLGFNATEPVLAELREAWGTDDPATWLRDWMKQRDMTLRLSDLDLPHDAIADVVTHTLAVPYTNPREVNAANLTRLLSDAWHGRLKAAGDRRVALLTDGVHTLDATVRGDDDAPAALLVLHGRGATADALLDRLYRPGMLAIAPQATKRSWYPRGFAAPVDDNRPDIDDALRSADDAWAWLTQRVPADRIVVVGFSQGACLALTWLGHAGVKPHAVVSFTGAPTPGLGTATDLAGTRVYLGCADEDPWVPRAACEAAAAQLAEAGATVTLHVEPGSTHAIHDHDRQTYDRLLEDLMTQDLEYLSGFGAALLSEAEPGAVPRRQNGPRKVPYGLYAEQINGTGFTVSRARNRRVWLYRLRPQVHENGWHGADYPLWVSRFDDGGANPEPLRFRPQPVPETPTDFVEGVRTFAGAGDPANKAGMAIHLYGANRDMEGAFVNLDGDLLLVPQTGRLRVQTELGWLEVAPGELLYIPRGIRFRVTLPDGTARGWMSELYQGHLLLPERGPVGANGLADERHFLAPVAAYENRVEPTRIVAKSAGGFYETTQPHSPFDVVGWHGNYVPMKYDLANFNSFGSVSFDHPDPSILTVLTAPHDDHGRSVLDVAVFAGRWDVTEGTFRPPFFHRNSAIEFNMVVKSPATKPPYDAGAYTYTPYLTPHGVSATSVERINGLTDEEADKPSRGSDESLWVQFESTYLLRTTPWARNETVPDGDFLQAFVDWPVGELGR